MRSIPKGFCAAILAISLVWPPSAAAEKSITERVNVMVVEVPVQVTRKGQPVKGLTEKDFELLVDGKKTRIASFDVNDVSLSAGQADAVPGMPTLLPRPPRHFLLLFDLSFSDVGSMLRSKSAARKIMTNSMEAADLVAVTTYSSDTGVRPLLNFTSDRAQILAAIDSMGVNQKLNSDPLNLTIVDPEAVDRAAAFADDRPGAGIGEEAAAEHLRDIQKMIGSQNRRTRAQAAGNLTRDFTQLARLLDSVRARKHVIYLSEGFDNDSMFATEDQKAQRSMSDSAERGQIWDVPSVARFGDTARISQLEGMIEEMRRSDCVVHAVDIKNAGSGNFEGGRASTATGGSQGLSAMASGTGGSYQRNSNQIGQALRNVLLETQVTYNLTIAASNLKKDGAFHKIKVRPVGAAKGAKVSHRPGFYALTPEEAMRPDQKRLLLGQQLMATTEGGVIPTAALAMPFAIDDDVAMVPILMEIDGKSLIGPVGARQIGVQIFAYAVERGSGNIYDYFSKTIGINVDSAGAAFSETGLKFYGSVNLPPGKYDLRLLVVEAISGRSNLRILPLDVPDFSTGAAELMPPLAPDAGGKWLLARVEPGEGQAPEPFPFMADQSPYLPSAHPSVQAGETLRLFVIGRNLGNGDIVATAELTDDAGQSVAVPEMTVKLTGRTGMEGYDGIRTGLPTTGLAPGEYTLALTVTAGAEPLTRTIPLTVR